tara:strand:- start:62 stop:625 length:564 start_codon:yes stop_codon:yes gene_type:complete
MNRNFYKVKKRKTKERNWTYYKSTTSEEDILKFTNIKNPDKASPRWKKAYELQITAYKKIHQEFPLVRFYDFKKQISKYAKLIYEDDFGFKEQYQHPNFLPDGYFLQYDQDNNQLEIFLIEVENKSRLTDEKLDTIKWWWLDSIDVEKYVPIYLLEFNRFGGFQRQVLNEGFKKDGFKLLKSYMNNE